MDLGERLTSGNLGASCRANLYFLALGACLALFFWFAAFAFACFCTACLCVAFGDLSPMSPRLRFILTNVNPRG